MNSKTVLLRQVHPQFVKNGGITSQAFMPTQKDDGKLSVYDGDIIDPQASYDHYTKVLGLESDSTWGVTCKEVEGVGLSSYSEPKEDFESHSVIEFEDSGIRGQAKKLKAFAANRGCIYTPGP